MTVRRAQALFDRTIFININKKYSVSQTLSKGHSLKQQSFAAHAVLMAEEDVLLKLLFITYA
jgi:hypothetical protein